MADLDEKIEYEVERKGGAAPDMDKGADRFKAGAKEIGKKVRDPDRDLETNIALGRRKKNSASFFFYCI
jgi:hypothetical protein